LVAYVTPSPEGAPDFDSVRVALKQRLPDYMVPSFFILLDAFPVMPNGKLDRKALPAPGDTALAPRDYVAPRDMLELVVACLFEELNNVRPVGVHSNFFELGGHSLLAVRLMAGLRQRTGVSLPLTALFQAPTVEQLAALCRRAPTEWSPLVPIQPGGERPPFFCVHPVGGNVLCFAELARALGPHQPVYALQAQGLDGKRPPLQSIAEMTRVYVQAIRALQPKGPYRVGGWSLGGAVAFDMACLLREQGEQVEVLALIEPTSASYARGAPLEDDMTLTFQFIQDLARTAGLDLAPPPDADPFDAEHLLLHLLAEGRKAGLFASDTDLDWLRAFKEVFISNLRALRQHTLHDFPGRTTLLLGSESQEGVTPLHDRDWGSLSSDVDMHGVPGNHYSLLRAPHVQELARVLTTLFEQADSRRKTHPQEDGTRLKTA
ncbi:alpha/beta fold hydrolase, partial [Corallococcus llansteffanensis]